MQISGICVIHVSPSTLSNIRSIKSIFNAIDCIACIHATHHKQPKRVSLFTQISQLHYQHQLRLLSNLVQYKIWLLSNRHQLLKSFSTYSTLPVGDPQTLADPLRRSDTQQWIKAMHKQLQSIEDNKTWTLYDLPPGCKSIGIKWVFKTKRDGSNNFQRYNVDLLQNDTHKLLT